MIYMADSIYSRGGGATPERMRQPITLRHFCRKLHENKRTFGPKGVGRVFLVDGRFLNKL